MDYQIHKKGKFNYVDQGEGEVLILLHGLFGALSNWKDVLDHFSKNYRVVIPIMPIFEMNILKLSVEGLANYIHDFIELEGYSKVHILGNSLGGHVALVYIKKYPKKVSTLLLTGSSGLYENAFGASYPRKGDKQYLRDRISLTFYDPSSTTDELVEEVYETIWLNLQFVIICEKIFLILKCLFALFGVSKILLHLPKFAKNSIRFFLILKCISLINVATHQ
jgi:pimeloyl-ACP methyl ester carboxylesterase